MFAFFGSHFGYIKFYFYLTSFFTPICFIFNFYICQNFNPSLFIHDFVLFMICVEVARRHGLCIKGSAPFNFVISYNLFTLCIQGFVKISCIILGGNEIVFMSPCFLYLLSNIFQDMQGGVKKKSERFRKYGNSRFQLVQRCEKLLV